MDISQFNQQINSCKQEYETLTKRTGQVEKESFQMLQARVNSLADVIERSEVDFPKNLQFTFGVACIEINDLAKKLQEYAKKHFDSDLDIHSPFAVNLYSSLKIEKKKTPETIKRTLVTKEAPAIKRAQETLQAEQLKFSNGKSNALIVLGSIGVGGFFLGVVCMPLIVPIIAPLGATLTVAFLATATISALVGGCISLGFGFHNMGRREAIEEKENNLEDSAFLALAENKGYTSSEDLLDDKLHELFKLENRLKALNNIKDSRPRDSEENAKKYLKYRIKDLEKMLLQRRTKTV